LIFLRLISLCTTDLFMDEVCLTGFDCHFISSGSGS
jgi:hypothetical protein